MRQPSFVLGYLSSVLALMQFTLLVGCTEPTAIVVPNNEDALLTSDGGSSLDSSTGDEHDALLSGDTSNIDGSLVLDSGLPEELGCRVPQSAVETSTPAKDAVQVLYDGAKSILLWADETGVHRCDINRQGQFVGEHVSLLPPGDFGIPQLESIRVGPYSYVAMSWTDQPTKLLRLDRNDLVPLEISFEGDGIYGPVHLSVVDGSLLVVGRNVAGTLAWVILENTWTMPIFTATSGFEGVNLDELVAVPSGVFFRFGDAGQCAFFDASRSALVSSVPCSLGLGGFVGDGQDAREWRLKRVESELYVSLISLFDQDAELVIGKLETQSLLSWPKIRGYQPMIARRILSEPSGRQGNLQLYLAGSSRLLESSDTWSSSFPYDEVRAFHLREAEVQTGRCTSTDLECESDDACFGSDLCEGRLGPYVVDLVSFGQSNQPRLESVGLDERKLRSTATIFDNEVGCVPVPEACDGRDQDCDGRHDDGVCCHVSQGRNDVSVTWTSGAPIEEFLISDVQSESAYLVVYRAMEGLISRWRGFTLLLRERDNGTYFDTIGSCNYPGGNCTENWSNSEHYPFAIDAGRGHTFLGIGGTRALIAKTTMDEGAPWAIYWIHAWRNHKPRVETDGPVILPDECEQIMVVEGLNRADGGESMILVCPDRVIRAYPNPDRVDLTWRFDGPELGGINEIVWATKLRTGSFGSHDRSFDLLVAFESDFGGRALRGFRFVTDDDGPPIPTPLNVLHPLLEKLDSNDLEYPIYLNRDSDGPLVRIIDGKAVEYANPIEGDAQDTVVWQPVQVGAPASRVLYSQIRQQLIFFGEPKDSGETPVFISSTAQAEGRASLWALEETFDMPATTVFSQSSQAFYDYNVLYMSLEDDGTDRNFGIRLVNLQCLAP